MASTGGERVVRSASDKEKTRLREKQRRAITTKIFSGLRKHGGYSLPSRADINEVLRELAREAGWVVEPDGTTYRPTTIPRGQNILISIPAKATDLPCCPVCGTEKKSATSTPTSSIVVNTAAGFGRADCSTTASPRHFPVGDSTPNIGGGVTSVYFTGGCLGGSIPPALYMHGKPASGPHYALTAASDVTNVPMIAAYQQQIMNFQEARASNQNTPAGSPYAT